MDVFRDQTPASKRSSEHKIDPTPEQTGSTVAAPGKHIDEQVFAFVPHDPAFHRSGLPATREAMLLFARCSGSGLVFDRELSLAQNGAMRIHVYRSAAFSWYIAYAMQGAFDNLLFMGRDIDYFVIDHALPGEDSEPLRKALALLQEGYSTMHITLLRKVESEAELRRSISAGTPRMTPKVAFDAIQDLIPVPLSVPGRYTSGDPGDAFLSRVYERICIPLKESLQQQGNTAAFDALEQVTKAAYAEIETHLHKSSSLVSEAVGRRISPDEWEKLSDAEKFVFVIETGLFGITPSALICVDFAQIIPNCLALSLLMMARASNSAVKEQLIDAGDNCDATPLLSALQNLATCDPEWSFQILTM